MFDDALRTSGVDPDISIPMQKVEWMQEQLVRDGCLPRPFDLTRMIDAEIRAKALDRIRQ